MSDDLQQRLFPATGMPDWDWWQVLWPEPDETMKALGIAPGLRVVDLCCGDGFFTIPMARLTSPERVVGIDLAPGMISRASDYAQRSGIDNIDFIVGDACDVPTLLQAPADVVVMANTFHGVPDKIQLSRSVRSILKPHGRFVVVNWYARPSEQTQVLDRPRGPKLELRMSPEGTAHVVERAGFQVIDVVQVGPYHYGAIFRRSEASTPTPR